MPIYEYVCGKCGKKTEVIQRVNEAHLKVCPHCGGRLKKAFSAPAIQFKGSGWYVTDYARAKQETRKSDSESGGEKAEEKARVRQGGESGEVGEVGESGEVGEERRRRKTREERKNGGQIRQEKDVENTVLSRGIGVSAAWNLRFPPSTRHTWRVPRKGGRDAARDHRSRRPGRVSCTRPQRAGAPLRRSVSALQDQSLLLPRHVSGWVGAVLAVRCTAHAEPAEPAIGRKRGARSDRDGTRRGGKRGSLPDDAEKGDRRTLKMIRGGPSEIRGRPVPRVHFRLVTARAERSRSGPGLRSEIPSAVIGACAVRF